MIATFSDRATIQAMLTFERALAAANARAGVIPTRAAEVISQRCDARAYDLDALARGAALAGNLAIPLVEALSAAVDRVDEDVARYVHWGATSQDVIDTALVLQMREGLAILEEDVLALMGACARQARAHARTVMAGRTWLQQATPITFGLKVAGWLSAVRRSQERLRALRPRALALQLGGASGSLAAFGAHGLAVMTALAEELGLPEPDLPWHTQRDHVVEVATTLGLLCGSLGKIARDVALLSQSEVAEVSEPDAPGRGGSSTMPQKSNPIGSAVALAAAQRVPNLVATLLSAMPQEHERGLGGWQAEWEVMPGIFQLTAGALRRMVEVVADLSVDAERMRANLDASQGVIFAESVSMALAQHVGKHRAHQMMRDISARTRAEGLPLRDILASDAEITRHLSPADLERLFDPLQASGLAETLVNRMLDGYHA
jgi:3-carboxy-cis,cis-muconate cycloisomerase